MKWTDTEEVQVDAMLREGYGASTIAQTLGRTVKSVERHLEHRKAKKPAQVFAELEPKTADPATPAPTADPTDRVDYWCTRALAAEKKLEANARAQTASEILCEIARDLAPKSYQDAPTVQRVARKPGSTPQEAVLMLSDTHIGQVVEPDQTLEMGGYNFEIFLRRLARLERSVESILQDHTTTEVPRIHVAMLGDMLHGNLVHSVEAGQRNTLFEQFFSAGHALAQFLRNLSAFAPIRVYTAVGNHPRFTGFQPKAPSDNTYSNLDQFLYAYTQALVHDVSQISWTLNKQPIARFDIAGYRFLAMHGTHLRGGDRILGIPAHAIGRNVSTHAQLAARSKEALPNYYLVGHLHRPIELPHTLGEFIVNGAFPGLDGLGLAEAYNSSLPQQKFFLVHPKFGRTACYSLRLDLGDKEPHQYLLPSEFCCR